MNTNVYRFVFEPRIVLEEAEMTLQLAIFAAEELFGTARVRLDFGYYVNEPRRTILVDGTTEVPLGVNLQQVRRGGFKGGQRRPDCSVGAQTWRKRFVSAVSTHLQRSTPPPGPFPAHGIR